MAPVAFAQDMKMLFNDVSILASDRLAGRGYVAGGAEKAAKFMAKRFAEVGLKPLVGASNYMQTYRFKVNTITSAKLLINNKEVIPGLNYFANAGSASGSWQGNAVFVDSAAISISGIGILDIINEREEIPIIDEKLVKRLDLRAFTGCFVTLVNAETMPAYTVAIGQHGYCNIIILQHVVKPDDMLAIDIKAKLIPNYKAENVIGRLEGLRHDSVTVVCAHYDHLGMMGKAIYRGVNDNASGSATLLQLAKSYVFNKPQFDMVFMAFSGEEAGLLGSSYYVEHPLFPLANIRYVLNLDLMATGDAGITVVNATVFPKLYDGLVACNDNAAVSDKVPEIKARGSAANSDHYSFSEKGVPALFIYARSAKKTPYHAIDDDMAHSDFKGYGNVYKLIQCFLQSK